jgi:hypothetical protein
MIKRSSQHALETLEPGHRAARSDLSRRMILILILALLGLACSPKPGNQSRSPNILFILTDDQGWVMEMKSVILNRRQ